MYARDDQRKVLCRVYGTGFGVTLVFLICNIASAANRIGATQVIAVTGQASPDGNGAFDNVSTAPQLNDAGTVLYSAALSGTARGDLDNHGLFRWSAGQSATVIREGDPLPNDWREFASINNPSLNLNGSVAFFNHVDPFNTTVPSVAGLYQTEGGTTTLLVAKGQTVPGGNGTFDTLSASNGFNSAEALAFHARIKITPSNLDTDSGMFLINQSGLSLVAREGQPVPTIPGSSYFEFSDPAINELGVMAFSASLNQTNGAAAIFKGVPGNLELVSQKGQPAPSGLGNFSRFSAVGLNESGQVSFWSTMTGGSSVAGIFRKDGATFKTIAADGQPSPDGGGAWSISQFGSPRALMNNEGQIFFSAFRADGARLFRSDGQQLVTIVHADEPNPDGDGTLGVLFNHGAFNDLGQAAFLVGFNGVPASQSSGLLFYDDALGLRVVAREGDALLGSTITGIAFSDEQSSRDTEQTGLNNFGLVAYGFELADGREGIALWAPVPEPPAMLLMLLGTTVLLCGARRRLADVAQF